MRPQQTRTRNLSESDERRVRPTSPRQQAGRPSWWLTSCLVMLAMLVGSAMGYGLRGVVEQNGSPQDVAPAPRAVQPAPDSAEELGLGEGRAAEPEREPASIQWRTIVEEDFDDLPTGRYTSEEADTGFDGATVTREDLSERDGYVVENPDGEGRSLEVRIEEGVILSAVFFDLAFDDVEEAWLSYKVQFGEGFDFSKLGGKLPGLGATAPGRERPPLHCDDPGANDGFSARHTWHQGGTLVQYLYFGAKSANCGEKHELYDGESVFEDGRWYEVKQRVLMNDADDDNGVIETWVDGELGATTDNLVLRTSDDYGVNRVVFSSYFGGKDEDKYAHERDERILYDDFKVTTVE